MIYNIFLKKLIYINYLTPLFKDRYFQIYREVKRKKENEAAFEWNKVYLLKIIIFKMLMISKIKFNRILYYK